MKERLQGKIVMNPMELWSRVLLDDFFVYDVTFDNILSATGSSTYELQIGDKDFHCMQFYMSMLDSNGVQFPEGLNNPAFAQLDGFTLDIVSSDDKRFFNNPANIWTLNKVNDNPLFKGMTFYNRTNYNFTIAGNNDVTAGSYPMKFKLEMIGYKLSM